MRCDYFHIVHNDFLINLTAKRWVNIREPLLIRGNVCSFVGSLEKKLKLERNSQVKYLRVPTPVPFAIPLPDRHRL